MSSPTSPARVLLLEDDLPFRAYIAGILNSSGRYRVVAEATSAEEASTWTADLAPALVLVDVMLPGKPGISAVAQLMEKFPGVHVIVFTGRYEDDVILDAIRAGAAGYVLKGTSSTELLAALEDAMNGGAPMSPSIARRVLTLMRNNGSTAPVQPAGAPARPTELRALTPREHDVLSLVANGASDKETAEQLGVSVSAVKQHLSNIYSKWRVRSRTEAAIKFTAARR